MPDSAPNAITFLRNDGPLRLSDFDMLNLANAVDAGQAYRRTLAELVDRVQDGPADDGIRSAAQQAMVRWAKWSEAVDEIDRRLTADADMKQCLVPAVEGEKDDGLTFGERVATVLKLTSAVGITMQEYLDRWQIAAHANWKQIAALRQLLSLYQSAEGFGGRSFARAPDAFKWLKQIHMARQAVLASGYPAPDIWLTVETVVPSVAVPDAKGGHLEGAGPLEDLPALRKAIAEISAAILRVESVPSAGTGTPKDTPKEQSKYDLFICHASEDKAGFVDELAGSLSRNWRVFYDKMVLTIGDNLRQKIDEGLVTCRFGVVVLSKAFFGRNWTRYELDGLVQRQMSEGRKIILPIWHEVDHADVLRYSASLAGVSAAKSSDGIPRVVEQIAEVLK